MDPEAGIHGSGGWDPWIRRPGSMGLAMAMAMAMAGRPAPAGRPVGRPRPAPAGRPGGRGLKEHNERKSEKTSVNGTGFVMSPEITAQPPPRARFSGPGALIDAPSALFRSFPTFEHFWSI